MATRFTPHGLVHEHSKDCSHAEDGPAPTGSLEERIRKVLIENAVDSTDNQGMHSWRCQYPDAYGPCDCFEELVTDLIGAVNAIE